MLIAERNGLLGDELPYDAQVEYLESTGTQWIDTGVPFVRNTITATFTLLYSNIWQNNIIVCCRFVRTNNTSGSTGRFWYLYVAREKFHRCYYSNWNAMPNSPTINALETYTATVSSSDAGYEVICNDITMTSDKVGASSNGITMTLFADVGNKTTSSFFETPVPMRIHNVKIFSANGGDALERDIIAVRKNGIGEMYDKVTGTFLERHGTFIIGPDKITQRERGGGGV